MSALDSPIPPPSSGLDNVAKYYSDDEKKAGKKRDSRSRSPSMEKEKKRDRRRRSRSSSASGDEKKRRRSRSSSRDSQEKKSRRKRSGSRDRRRSRSRTYSPNRRSSSGTVTRIHVSGFDGGVSRRDLSKAFGEFGEVTDIWLTSRQPHYAFITFQDARDADDAMKTLNDTTLCGSRIRIAHALPRRIGSGGGGGRYGGGGGGGGRRDYGGRDYGGRDSYRRRSRTRSRSPPRRRDRRSSSRSRSRS